MTQPIKKIRAGAITATLWENQNTVNGQQVTNHSINIERSYKDNQGNWQKTTSMGVNDLPKVSLVTEKAYEFLVLKEEVKQTQQPQNSGQEMRMG